MGGIQFPKLATLAKEIWQWCEKRDLWLFASYISSAENTEADRESRSRSDETEWSLSPTVFTLINKSYGNFEVDLFATYTNKKCNVFYSWIPDLETAAVDAFTVFWGDKYFYAFPPFALVLRVLRKIIVDRAEGILVVPYWKSQPWFPIFQKLLVSEPLILGPDYNLLNSPFRKEHPLWRSLSLAAGKLSAKRFCQEVRRTQT